MCVVLGDNLFEDDLSVELEAYRQQTEGARILLKPVPDPERFGVPTLKDSRITRIDEKPDDPASPYAVVGIYFYDSRVFDIIRTLTRSARGEYEITDVSNDYLSKSDLTYGVLSGWWSDCGTFESLNRASNLVRKQVAGQRENRYD
jgi:glucose-1-phosphate thymidylyltransferase